MNCVFECGSAAFFAARRGRISGRYKRCKQSASLLQKIAKIETGQGESGIIGAERGGVAAKGVYGNEKTDFSDFGALHGVIGMHEGGSGESADCGERGGFFRGKHRERREECGE